MFEQCIVAAKCLANTLFKYLYETACKKGREREREREKERKSNDRHRGFKGINIKKSRQHEKAYEGKLSNNNVSRQKMSNEREKRLKILT